jgi:hypothetical protein
VRTHLPAVICTDRFTLRNPHCVPPRKVALMVECKEHNLLPFRIGTDWGDRADANDPAFGDFLMGAYKFTVKQMSRNV